MVLALATVCTRDLNSKKPYSTILVACPGKAIPDWYVYYVIFFGSGVVVDYTKLEISR